MLFEFLDHDHFGLGHLAGEDAVKIVRMMMPTETLKTMPTP